MTYDPYVHESSGDNETTTEQVYLRHIRQELQQVTLALHELAQVIRVQTVVQAAGDEARWARVPDGWVVGYGAYTGQAELTYTQAAEEEEEPDSAQEVDVPDYGPPGSGAVITEWP